MEDISVYTEKAIKMGMEYGPRLLLAIVVLLMGLSIIKNITQFLKNSMLKKNVDPTLTPFLINLVGWGLKVLLLISVASMVGIATTSFVAVLGAAGLAIGLALQGSLANFAGGVLILIFRPFVKDDFIEAQGEMGTVESIDIFATIIKTLDNKKVIIPNGPLAGGTVKNYTAHQYRRVDLSVGISYDDDIRKAISAIKEMCRSNSDVLDNPEPPFAGVVEYGDNSINLTIRVWTHTEKYWDVFFDLNEKIKYTFDKAGLSIPYPQRDLHIIKGNL